MPSMSECLGAADACAEDTKVGIGGWVITSTAVAWFAEMWEISELRQTWKLAQAYIASFETLAQFALLQSTYHVSRHSHLQIQVPTGTDNTATEAGLNKLFTTKWPLCHSPADRFVEPRPWHSLNVFTYSGPKKMSGQTN